MRDRVQQFDIPGGRDMSRSECFARFKDHINSTKACLRGMSLHEHDARYLMVVRWLDKIEDTVGKEFNKRRNGQRLLWLPGRPEQ